MSRTVGGRRTGGIRVLDDDMVRRIAAGEVVERPASVVKELVENSLDAGAGRVEISIVDGGRGGIRVADDGRGIPVEELPLALAPHATSKITSVDDLERISTLGFRGEALASIGRVARVEIRSRPPGSEHGFRIVMRGGDAKEPEPCACPEGTSVVVEELFYNLPARRKFLRHAAAEAARVSDVVTGAALAAPAVAFRLALDERPALSCRAAADALERIRDVFGESEETGALVTGRSEEHGVRVSAVVAPPYVSRRDGRMLFFFVNSRPVVEQTLRRAVSDALRPHLPPSRQPVAFVYVDLPPAEVDVNIHPAKIEIRFRKPGFVYTAVRKAVEDALSSVRRFYATRGAPSTGGVERAVGDFLARRGLVGQSSLGLRPPQETRGGGDRVGGRPPDEPPVPRGRYMVLHDSYIIVETPLGFTVIDQHALHERLIYDRLRALSESGELGVQRLLVPVELNVDAAERTAYEQNRDVLAALGFDTRLDGSRLVILSAPAIGAGARMDVEDAVRETLSVLMEDVGAAYGRRLQSALKSVACHAAVKAGQRLSDHEVERLLYEARRCHTPPTCPHGRPLLKHVPLQEMERWFKR